MSESKNEGNSKNKSFNEDAIKETNLIDLDRYNKYIKDQEKEEEEKREKRNELKKELSNLMEAKRYVESHLRDFPNDLLAREDLERITAKTDEIHLEINKIDGIDGMEDTIKQAYDLYIQHYAERPRNSPQKAPYSFDKYREKFYELIDKIKFINKNPNKIWKPLWGKTNEWRSQEIAVLLLAANLFLSPQQGNDKTRFAYSWLFFCAPDGNRTQLNIKPEQLDY